MDAVTILVALSGTVAIWTMRPSRGLIVYLALLVLYPQYLALSFGTVEVTTSRVLGVMLLLRALTFRAQPPSVRLLWMDALILATFAGSTVAHLLTTPAQTVLVRDGGHFLDSVIPYFIVRYSIRTRADVILFLRCITIIAIPLAIVGLVQTFTGFNVYAFTRPYSPWQITEQPMMQRYGMYRANGPFEDKISFGLYFVLALAAHIGLTFFGRIRPPVWLAHAGTIFAGVVSSMSSSPLFAAVASLGWIGVRPFRRRLPFVFVAGLIFILFIELYSTRHFYHVLTRFALDSQTAYYRIELVEEALGGGMTGHWLAGFGFVGVGRGTDNSNFTWEHQDLANIYVLRLATGGLLSLLPYLVLNIYFYVCLYRASRAASDFPTHWLNWCLAAALLGWNVAFMTVGALTQIEMLFGMMMGMVAVWVRVASESDAEAALPEPEPEPVRIAPPPVDEPVQPVRSVRESWFRRTQ